MDKATLIKQLNEMATQAAEEKGPEENVPDTYEERKVQRSIGKSNHGDFAQAMDRLTQYMTPHEMVGFLVEIREELTSEGKHTLRMACQYGGPLAARLSEAVASARNSHATMQELW